MIERIGASLAVYTRPQSYDSEFSRLSLKSNEKRKEEIIDKSVRRETEKIKKRVEALEKLTTKL